MSLNSRLESNTEEEEEFRVQGLSFSLEDYGATSSVSSHIM